ncbi:hypothetical protein [Idiomarina xiamenensis]|uniref:Uncharacterized protein n=1 Tax=Idiomarina xiamenensis 10-D-4 TaxID=740709 RepID=K2JHT1_9GAMM|nr:hypothetical protein [Idiomarina xiamenensis]EKE82941.1 hypothetical protein A10D4_08879 [Idiomarina xiamenensis 10-D-4]
MKKVVLIETILVMITGVLLTLVRYSENGMISVNSMAKGVETNSTVIYTLLAFLGLAIVSRWIRRTYGNRVYHFRDNMLFAEEVFEGVGSGLLGIYRLMSGIAITVPFIWYFAERDTFDFGRAIAILVTGLLFFAGLAMLSWLNDKSKGY